MVVGLIHKKCLYGCNFSNFHGFVGVYTDGSDRPRFRHIVDGRIHHRQFCIGRILGVLFAQYTSLYRNFV